jgi:translocation and assembly module TamB
MATQQKKKRRWLRVLLGLVVAGILVLVLLPVWFPWVLAPVAGRFGLGFAEYDRLGWTRFALTEVRGEWNGTQLEAQRVESVLPTTWLWRRWSSATNDLPLVSVTDVQLRIGGPTTNPFPERAISPGSAGGTLDQITQIARTLQQWLPRAELTNLTIQIESDFFSVPQANWQAGRLRATARVPETRGELELVAQLEGTRGLKFTMDWAASETSLRGDFSRTAAGWNWLGELAWRTNRAELTAQFTTNSWWPAQAHANFRQWQIPAEFLQVEGYEKLVASLTANIVSNRFDVQATGFAEPSDVAAESGWPAVNFSFGADGSPAGVKLNSLNIQSPWLNADLTNSVGMTRTGKLLAAPAELRVALDLEKLPGAGLTGKAEGVVRIEPQAGRAPELQFQLTAEQVRAGSWAAKRILAQGGYRTPQLKLDELRVELADGSVLLADGDYDGVTRTIGAGRWKLSGAILKRFLPDLSYAEMMAAGELRGPLTNLAHTGEASITAFQATGLKPLEVRAKWRGEMFRFDSVALELTAGKSVLSLGARADFNAAERKLAATVNQLFLRREAAELYALAAPSAITFQVGATNASEKLWSLAVSHFVWQSERRAISAVVDFTWPVRGETTLALTNVAGADFSDFIAADLASILVGEFNGTAQWSNGPVRAAISLAGSVTNNAGQIFSLRGKAQTEEQLALELTALASGFTPTLSVTGMIPVQVRLDRGAEGLVWNESQSIALVGNWKDAQTETFSIPLGRPGQLEVLRPAGQLRISGTLEAPSAELTASVAQLVWRSQTNHTLRPKLEDLQLAVTLRPDAIQVKTFTAKLDGQPMFATGEWLLTKRDWQELWATQKLPDWNRARGHLELAEAQVAAVAAYLPEVLAPEGRLSATLDLEPGKQLQGRLTLTNAATRPLGPITPLRDIDGVVQFDGQRAELQNFRAQIGGQPIRADGFMTVPERDGSGLDYHVNLSGTNVPLARSPELLLRGDFAVTLRGGSKQATRLAGTVTLRDGLFVQNASALVWNSPRRPEWRPPYFSVTNQPFANWSVDLAVRGNRFLRVRTPVFSSIASADFQLRGSLRTPVLTGDARVNSGRLIFPFGALAIDQGLVSFSGNDPRGPELQINASGRNYRYDLRLEVEGPADGANVIFSSTPPLGSEQILLMLTAGEIPQSDYAYTDTARAGRLVTFLGQDLLSRYLGSDPAKERLIIQTGESISEAGQLTYSIEYRLSDRWSIIGEYDEFNAFNTDLKWKVFNR